MPLFEDPPVVIGVDSNVDAGGCLLPGSWDEKFDPRAVPPADIDGGRGGFIFGVAGGRCVEMAVAMIAPVGQCYCMGE